MFKQVGKWVGGAAKKATHGVAASMVTSSDILAQSVLTVSERMQKEMQDRMSNFQNAIVAVANHNTSVAVSALKGESDEWRKFGREAEASWRDLGARESGLWRGLFADASRSFGRAANMSIQEAFSILREENNKWRRQAKEIAALFEDRMEAWGRFFLFGAAITVLLFTFVPASIVSAAIVFVGRPGYLEEHVAFATAFFAENLPAWFTLRNVATFFAIAIPFVSINNALSRAAIQDDVHDYVHDYVRNAITTAKQDIVSTIPEAPIHRRSVARASTASKTANGSEWSDIDGLLSIFNVEEGQYALVDVTIHASGHTNGGPLEMSVFHRHGNGDACPVGVGGLCDPTHNSIPPGAAILVATTTARIPLVSYATICLQHGTHSIMARFRNSNGNSATVYGTCMLVHTTLYPAPKGQASATMPHGVQLMLTQSA